MAVGATLAGCGDSGSTPGWAGAIDTVSGVPVVRNPEEAALAAGQVTLAPLWRQAGEEADLWVNPSGIAAGAGRVWVLDPAGHRVRGLDPATGAVVVSFGRRGRGPGELALPMGIAAGDSLVHVADAGKGALETFAPDGRHVAGSSLGTVPLSVAWLGADRFLVERPGPTPLAVFQEGVLSPLTAPAPVAGVDVADTACEGRSGLDGAVALFSCTTPYIRIVDLDGAVRREVRVDRPSEERSNAELDRFASATRADLAERGTDPGAIAAFVQRAREDERYRKQYVRLRRDPDSGRFLLLRQDWHPGEIFVTGPPRLLVFDGAGRFLAEIEIPARWVDFVPVDGHVVALETDSATGVVSAVRYAVQGL